MATDRNFKVKNGIDAGGTITTTSGDVVAAGILKSNNSAANEGGEIQLALPSSGSTLSTGVVVDIYQNKLRFFESGGTNRGAYIDISAASASVGSDLLAGGSSGVSSISFGTTGLTPSAAATGAVTVAGTLSLANGGTGQSLTATNGGVVYSTASAMAITLAGTSGQALVSAGTGAPTWLTLTLENLPGAWVKRTVKLATTVNLTATYANGTSGVGATLTNSGTLEALVLDGISLFVNDRVLIKDQTTALQNGIYTVTTAGSGSVAWVLTRSADADTPDEIAGGVVAVDQGTQGGSKYSCYFKSTDTIGTTAITFFKIADSSSKLNTFAATTSAELASIISDEQGSGRLVFDTSPTLTTPNIGSATGTSLTLTGSLTAATKSFDIIHPTKENMRLRYGSLEGPENGVYIRGKSKDKILALPDYWTGLVDADSITVQLTAIGTGTVYVDFITNNSIKVGGTTKEFYYFVQAERKDVDKLTVEY